MTIGLGANFVLTPEWTRYTLKFDSLHQFPKWGQPRPARMDPSRLYGIQFRVRDAEQPFDVWIDDVAFIEADPPPIAPPDVPTPPVP